MKSLYKEALLKVKILSQLIITVILFSYGCNNLIPDIESFGNNSIFKKNTKTLYIHLNTGEDLLIDYDSLKIDNVKGYRLHIFNELRPEIIYTINWSGDIGRFLTMPDKVGFPIHIEFNNGTEVRSLYSCINYNDRGIFSFMDLFETVYAYPLLSIFKITIN